MKSDPASRIPDPEFWVLGEFGGILTLDANEKVAADWLMAAMQDEKFEHLTVSRGYFKSQ